VPHDVDGWWREGRIRPPGPRRRREAALLPWFLGQHHSRWYAPVAAACRTDGKEHATASGRPAYAVPVRNGHPGDRRARQSRSRARTDPTGHPSSELPVRPPEARGAGRSVGPGPPAHPGRHGLLAVSRPIVLVGLMGCGKTTVGTALAERLGRPFWDGDAQLKELTGMAAAGLGAERGLDVLRRIEVEVLALGLAHRPAPVVAAAAATILDPRLPGLIGLAWTVWLRVEVTHLAARLRRDDGHHPLLAGDLLATLREMARVRDPLYGRVADLTVDATRAAPAVLVGRIVAELPPGF